MIRQIRESGNSLRSIVIGAGQTAIDVYESKTVGNLAVSVPMDLSTVEREHEQRRPQN
jgi:hypothetical protein